MFNQIYHGRRVIVTGHTGFKGSWLVYWLEKLGANVCGIALPKGEDFNHFGLLKSEIRSEMQDIRDIDGLLRIFKDFQPEVVFHLAAQPLVRLSYEIPVETFATNIMGTVNVLECVRRTSSVNAVVVISSDKCYENREWVWGYRENEPMGGYDPYSASKGCTELVVSSYRRSFFNNADFGIKHHTLLASGRAGNVIGGGDWATDRLVPDIMKAAAAGKEVEIRSPQSTRPWQHVLEPLSGYLALGQKLLEKDVHFADGWNFGPTDEGIVTVEETADALKKEWPEIQIRLNPPKDAPHEANLLRLDCTKARSELKWHSVWSSAETFFHTTRWYREFYQNEKVTTDEDIQDYIDSANEKEMLWTK